MTETVPPPAPVFQQVPTRADLVQGEHEVLQLWESSHTFDKLRAKGAGKPRWSFLDGPITANGFMGVHHAWGRTYKDAFQRYFAMAGHELRWQQGFDCQGLWVEVQVERDLGFKSKRDIEEYGIEEFIQRCKERVWKYSAIQTRQSIRLGMWSDWPNSYFTMSDENNYTIWSFLKRCHERGLIYRGLDAMPWCPRCGTGISEQERKEGYKVVEDPAVYVKFPLSGSPGESLLVWTTTPWTLAANVAAAVNPGLTYVKARVQDDIVYVSKGSLGVLGKGAEVLCEISGAGMVGWTYAGPFDHLPAAGAARQHHRVISWKEVADGEGTGIVHIAPGCGKEDFDLGRQEGLSVVQPIDDSGIYMEGFGFLTGKSALEVADVVIARLKEKGLLFKQERYRHDYPHCWRCGTPLLFRAVEEWYINMGWRDEIKQVVKQARWIPEYGQDLELDWLSNMGDWMISKKRYWGLALPIFVCNECNHFDVIGGREELEKRAVAGWESFVGDPANPNSPHRPYIDHVRISCDNCEGVAKRILDVGNPWLDAGIVPYSTTKYNADRDHWKQWMPADFVTESFPGQFRNWFYALLTMSTMMEGITPFKTLLGYASVRDENGEEMHYSKGNSIEFDLAADKMSADVMRWMYCRHNPTQNLNFGFAAGEQLERKVFGTLWNSYLFFVNYAILDRFDPSGPPVPVSERLEIDRWILSDLQLLVQSANTQFQDYLMFPFIRRAEEFIDQLSNWYIRRNRSRFWDPAGLNPADKAAAYQTLHEVLLTLTKVLAPVVPFLTERMYQNLSASGHSVHLCDYPVANDSLIDQKLSSQMGVAQQVASAARSLREQAAQRVRQPLAELRVGAPGAEDREALEELRALILDELNVKSLTVSATLGDLTTYTVKPNFRTLGAKHGAGVQTVAALVREAPAEIAQRLGAGQTVELGAFEVTPQDVAIQTVTAPGWAVGSAGSLQIALDIRLTGDLLREGFARDVVRHIQQLRKDSGLQISDRIEVSFHTGDAQLLAAIKQWRSFIMGEVQANSFSDGAMTSESASLEIAGKQLQLRLIKSLRS
ncbi:MAG: isoleucine--tRNA ligase [Actinomycetota bacterium]